MSDESATSPEASPNPPAKSVPRARRSPQRPKKKAQALPVADESPAPGTMVSEKVSGFPEFPESTEAIATPPSETDWPEPEAESSGGATASENPKRKRRRKKGKGNTGQSAALQGSDENVPQPAASQPQAPRQNQAPHLKLDSETLSKCAWKIYLAEISEEGVALVGDNDAKELARRCFRLAEIFIEEQSRHR